MKAEQFTELRLAAIKGDKIAFARLYNTVYKDLFYIAFYSLKDEKDAESAVKETIVDAFTAISTPNLFRDLDGFKLWITQILTAKIKKRFKLYAQHEIKIAYDKSNEKLNSDGIDIKQEFNSLPDFDRLVLALEIVFDYNTVQIAKLIDFSAETVETRLSNADIILRQRLLNLESRKANV